MATGRAADYSDQTPELWAKTLFHEAESLTFWHSKEGPPGSSSPIIRRDELLEQPGDTIRVDIALALTGSGTTGDTETTEGREERLKFRQTTITTTLIKHGVRWTELAEAQITHNMRQTARMKLARWLAGQLDDRVFDELTGAGTTVPDKNKWYAGTATTRDTVADTDAGGRLTLDTLTELKAYAQVEIQIEPLRTEDGNEFFGLVVHPYAAMSLKRDDTKWAQAQREAQIRGADNPLFTGALGVWDGVILFSSNRVPASDNANSPAIQVADNVFFGAQALSRGYGFFPKWVNTFGPRQKRFCRAKSAHNGETLTAEAAGDAVGSPLPLAA